MGDSLESIRENLDRVRDRIKKSLDCSNRSDKNVLLLAVTKTVDIDAMEIARECGITDVGENKPQELSRKYSELGEKFNWHQIGTLQSNKVKYIIDKVSLIHSLDRRSLADEIQRQATIKDLTVDCLVQVNISKEDTKHGLYADEVEEFIRYVSSSCDRIRIRGLMTMAPFGSDENLIRNTFRGLKELAIEIDKKNISGVSMKELSMGMSNDFEIAIQEGATIVRVGTSIFGERNYN